MRVFQESVSKRFIVQEAPKYIRHVCRVAISYECAGASKVVYAFQIILLTIDIIIILSVHT